MSMSFGSISTSAVILLVAVPVQGGQALDAGRLSQAKALYDSADYDTALNVLDAIKVEGTPADARDRVLYRALCLLALGRQADAEAAAAQLVDADPVFSPGADLSPRLRTLLEEVRTRALPALIQKHYLAGKDLYDRADYPGAVRELSLTIELLDRAGGGDPTERNDLKTLAVGFRDLAKQRIVTSGSSRAPTAPAHTAGPVPASVEPVPIRQDIPPPPPYVASLLRQRGNTMTGSLEIVISPTGIVERARMTGSIHPAYDAELLAASKRWRYQPGARNGAPAEFVKRVIVNVHLP